MKLICWFISLSDGNDGVSDFEAMLAKKREEQSRKRKRKDIDIINDNDDIIAQLLADMRSAAEVMYNIYLFFIYYFFTHRMIES